jgi:hypothetical protein
MTRVNSRSEVAGPKSALAAGWVTPSRSAARVTLRSRSSSRSTAQVQVEIGQVSHRTRHRAAI